MKNKTISGDKAATKPSHDSKLPAAQGNVPPTDNRQSIPTTQVVENRKSDEALPRPRNAKSLEFTYVDSPALPIEPLVTRETVCKHYKIGLRTLTYAVSLGLPSVPIGRSRRFKFSEIQPWFEKNGYRRIASEGRKLAIQKALLKAKQFHLALSSDVEIVNEQKGKAKSATAMKKGKL